MFFGLNMGPLDRSPPPCNRNGRRGLATALLAMFTFFYVDLLNAHQWIVAPTWRTYDLNLYALVYPFTILHL